MDRVKGLSEGELRRVTGMPYSSRPSLIMRIILFFIKPDENRAQGYTRFGVPSNLKIGRYSVHADPRKPATAMVDLGDIVMFALVALMLFVLFFFSAMFLARLGIHYEAAGGSKLEKIHIATYLAFMAFGFAALRRGNPLTYALELILKFPIPVYFMGLCFLMMVYAIKVQGNPFTLLIDTFVLTFLTLILIAEVKPSGRALLALGLHFFMLCNALLGIGEVLSGHRLTPFTLGSLEVIWDWRATAFLGHPLINSILTGSYALMLLYATGNSVPRYLRFALAGIQVVALLFFGGRTSLVLTLAFIGVGGGLQFVKIMFGGTIRKTDFVLGVLALPLAGAGLIVAYNIGVMDQMLERFVSDDNSAATRFILFDMVNSIGLDELLFGVEPAKLRSMQWTEGTEYGIESFWFGFLFDYGLILSGFFFIGLGLFWFHLLQLKGKNGWIVMLFYVVVSSAAASLSVKSITFAAFVALFLLVFDSPPRLRRSVNVSHDNARESQ